MIYMTSPCIFDSQSPPRWPPSISRPVARRPADAAALLGERAAARRAALVGDRQRSVAARALSEP